MMPTEYCASCNEAVLWKCSSCEKENDRSVHTYHPRPSGEITTTAHSSVVGLVVSVVSSFAVALHV
jgi:hypothetical protein